MTSRDTLVPGECRSLPGIGLGAVGECPLHDIDATERLSWATRMNPREDSAQSVSVPGNMGISPTRGHLFSLLRSTGVIGQAKRGGLYPLSIEGVGQPDMGSRPARPVARGGIPRANHLRVTPSLVLQGGHCPPARIEAWDFQGSACFWEMSPPSWHRPWRGGLAPHSRVAQIRLGVRSPSYRSDRRGRRTPRTWQRSARSPREVLQFETWSPFSSVWATRIDPRGESPQHRHS